MKAFELHYSVTHFFLKAHMRKYSHLAEYDDIRVL